MNAPIRERLKEAFYLHGEAGSIVHVILLSARDYQELFGILSPAQAAAARRRPWLFRNVPVIESRDPATSHIVSSRPAGASMDPL